VAAPPSLQGQIADLEARRDVLLGIARSNLNPEEAQPGQNPAQPSPDGREMEPPVNNRGRRYQGPRGQGGRQDGPWLGRGGSRLRPEGRTNEPLVIPALPDVKIWAHDLTVKPGKTYRYLMIVSVLDRLFHSNEVSREQYQEYFNKLSLSSPPSEWSEPVKVDPSVYFFLTGQDAARRQATVDVFHIFNGVWARQSFQVKAGDPIGGTVSLPYKDQTQAVDMHTNAVVVDIHFPVSRLGLSTNVDQTRMIVFKSQSNGMTSRTLGQDTKDPTYERLLREMQVRSVMASTN
jgi:hypothetical protein